MCFKPNDLQPGDVLEYVYMGNAIILVVAVDRANRSTDTVMIGGDLRWAGRAIGDRLTTNYTRKSWKRFNKNFRYLSRGWNETLRLQQEEASAVESGMMTE